MSIEICARDAAADEPLDHRHHAAQLLLRRDRLGARAASTRRRCRGCRRPPPPARAPCATAAVRVEEPPAVGERVRRDVDDAHDPKRPRHGRIVVTTGGGRSKRSVRLSRRQVRAPRVLARRRRRGRDAGSGRGGVAAGALGAPGGSGSSGGGGSSAPKTSSSLLPVEQRLELLRLDRLALDEDLGDRRQRARGARSRMSCARWWARLDDAADLVVDLARDLVGVVGLGARTRGRGTAGRGRGRRRAGRASRSCRSASPSASRSR